MSATGASRCPGGQMSEGKRFAFRLSFGGAWRLKITGGGREEDEKLKAGCTVADAGGKISVAIC